MSTAGIVFSNIHDRNVSQLTTERTMASVPIGGRYRLIDFILSNMVNAGITKVGIICKTNYQSLARHIGTGKDWDLARKEKGIVILSPYSDKEAGPLYSNRLEALQSARVYINSCDEDYFIMSDSDVVANLPYDKIIEQHEASGADITGVYKTIEVKKPIHRTSTLFDVSEDGRITGLTSHTEIEGTVNFGMNVWVMNRELVKNIIQDSITYGKKSLSREVLAPMVAEGKIKIMAYEHKGYIGIIDSLDNYFVTNMDLLRDEVRQELFHTENYPIITKVKDSAPTRYGSEASVVNSIISDGCLIEGTVENSILFRGVHVAKDAVVKNSIIMQDCILEARSNVNYLITDKRVVVGTGKSLSGCEGHPFYIEKGSIL